MAAKRREGSAWMEEEMKKEREVQWLAKLRGGQLVQKGRFLVSESTNISYKISCSL